MLANVALHGLELALAQAAPRKYRVTVIRYADDLVVLCADLDTLLKVKVVVEEWLAEMGLRLKPSKTRITHTLEEYEGNVGFDFLGFHVRQYRVGKYRTRTDRGQEGFKTYIRPSQQAIQRHQEDIGAVIRQHRGAPQVALITALNPIVRGWSQYYRTVAAKNTLNQMGYQTSFQLRRWAGRRHPGKKAGWRFRRYWRRQGKRMSFTDGKHTLVCHADTPIVGPSLLTTRGTFD